MKTNQEHSSKKNNEAGIGLVYILIAVGLFAALSFMLTRTINSSETATLSPERTELYSTQLINYAVQAKSAIDQMLFTGSDIGDLDFSLPGEAAFSAGTQSERIHYVYHPDGGGLNAGKFTAEITLAGTNPTTGWHMGRFNNIEWTDTAATDIILTAYRIPREICENINDKVTGNTTIPVIAGAIETVLVDDARHSGTNVDLDIADCAECEGYSSLCVSDTGATTFAFYTIIADR